MTGATIGSNVMIAAGTILLPGVEVPAGQLWGGNPGVFMRNLTAEDVVSLEKVREMKNKEEKEWKLMK